MIELRNMWRGCNMKDNQKLIEWVLKHNYGICASTNINSSKLKQFNGKIVLLTTTGQSEELDVDNMYWEKCSDGSHNFWVYDAVHKDSIAPYCAWIAPYYACTIPPTNLYILEKNQQNNLEQDCLPHTKTVEAYDRAMKPLRNM